MPAGSVRRRFRFGRVSTLTAAALAAALALTACGSSTGEDADGGTTEPAVSSSDGAATDESAAEDTSDDASPEAPTDDADQDGEESSPAYPITLTTPYGDVTIPEQPERVVTLTIEAADALISLGIEPIAVAADPATFPATHPWMVGKIDDVADAALVSGTLEINYEAIAQLQPDLILGTTYVFSDAAAFERMNSIAPTVIENSTAVNVDWDQRLLTAGEAFGLTDKAQAMIDDIRAEFSAIGAEVPDIASKTYQFIRVDPDGYGFGNGSVLDLFGLQPAANQDNTQNGPGLSKENTSQLDADVLGVWAPTEDLRTSLDNDPLFQALPSVANGTVFYLDMPLAFAANTPAPMALAWLKDVLAPTIRALG